MLCRLKTIIHAVDDLPENLLKQCVLENDAAHAQLERFAEDLSTAESSAISFFKLMNDSVEQEKARMEEVESPAEESSDPTSEEYILGEGEVAQTSEALRQSTSTLPVEYVEEEGSEESEESPDQSDPSGSDSAPAEEPVAAKTDTPEIQKEQPKESVEEEQTEVDPEAQEAEEKRKQEEEERKRKEEEEAEKERRRQEEREQM